MTIPRNLSILAEGASSSGILAVTNGGTGVTTSTGSGDNVLSASPTLTGTLTVPIITSPSATALTLQSVGTTAMTIDTSQNVGIGTIPFYKLHVYGSAASTVTYITSQAAGAGSTASFAALGPTSYATFNSYSTGDASLFNQYATGALWFGTNASERMRIDSSGNVGIGTSSPTNTFTVKSATIYRGISVNNGTNDTVQIIGQATGNDNGSVILLNGGTANVYVQASGNSYFNGGNVGIGTSSPGTKLTVNGGFAVQGGTYPSSGAGLESWYDGTNVYLQTYNRTGSAWLPLQINTSTTTFSISAGEKMRIDSSGNVGIGTTANASAILDAQSTTKGVRFPNMTTTQKNAVSSPAAGLVVFDTTLSKLCVYSGSAWQTITSV
jgi:hypothetical protein